LNFILTDYFAGGEKMAIELTGFHRKIHHTRYAKKALNKHEHLTEGQAVVVLTKDGKYPVRELGKIHKVEDEKIHVKLDSGDFKETFPDQIFTQDLHNVDILLETEFEQTAHRVAKAISDVEELDELKQLSYEMFYDAISNFHLIPAGRILTGAGDDSKVTLFNCYVIDVEKNPAFPEAGVDSRQAIFHHMGRISEIMARGGGVGTCLSVFRPRYAPLSQTKGRSTGAVFIGNMFSGLTNFIEQGNRRGAQMLTIHDYHPDVFYTNDPTDPNFIEDFIGAKQKAGFMEGNNSSVLISDAFMKAVEEDGDWDLVFPDTTHPAYNDEWNGDLEEWKSKGFPVIVHRTIKAKDMWNKLMESNRVSAEPGVLFIDRINKYHNGQYLGKVKSTNPCGEQPILGNSTCNLSAINLGRMLKKVDGKWEIDWDLLAQTVYTGVIFLDNVIDATYFFDKDMEEWQTGERRLGLGILGLHDMLIALELKYGSPEANKVFGEVMEFIRDTAYNTSIDLAIEKGSFPLFDYEGYMQSEFAQELPESIKLAIKEYGIRNLTILTVAPTGTTGSMTPSLLDPQGSVSTGLEPHFAMKYERLSRIGKTTQYAGVAKAWLDANPDQELPEYFVGAMELTPEEHVEVQAVAQKYVCSSISKTVNAPKGYTLEEVKRAYEHGYKMGLKGMTIYVDESRDEQILSLGKEEDQEEKGQEEPVNKPKGKYDNWECGNCGSKKFVLVENCPQCTECGNQSCSIF
jgi:ribonucleoside-diphosphate reductase alpha chain